MQSVPSIRSNFVVPKMIQLKTIYFWKNQISLFETFLSESKFNFGWVTFDWYKYFQT